MSGAAVPADDDAALREALIRRAAQFRRALRHGGSRDEYRAWQASDEALQIALGLLDGLACTFAVFPFSNLTSGA